MKHIPRLLSYLKSYKLKLVFYFICVVLSTVFALFSFGMLAPVLQVLFTDETTKFGDQESWINRISFQVNELILQFDKLTALSIVVGVVVIFTILKNGFLYLSLRIINPIKNGIIRKLRDDVFSKTLSLPIGFFNEERKGDLVSKMTNDVNEVEVSIMNVIETVIREPITILLTLLAMLQISPQMTLFLLLFLPFAGFIIGSVGKTLKKPSNAAQEELSYMMSNVEETIGGMRIVKAFNAERIQLLKFRIINNKLFRIKNKISSRRDAGSPLSETLGIVVVGVILWYGGWLIFAGKTDMTGPWFLGFIALFYQIINPVKNLSTAFYNMQKGAAALERIQNLMQVDNTIKEQPDAIVLNSFNNAIELKNVSFGYPDRMVLKNINLTIEKGKTIALVGASGSGKSSLADLIPRFHDVQSGEICIDGKNVKSLNLFAYRQLIGIVTQEAILFNDSIENNIKLGASEKSHEQIMQAAKVANAYEFIQQKKHGWQTEVGDRGNRLSGGERQRVTIARAVLKDPPILILDEATSSLDTASEKLVQDAINHLMKNRTCLVIAHRLSTIQHADEIIVLDKGEIIERGTHQSLMNMDSAYKKLVQMQKMA